MKIRHLLLLVAGTSFSAIPMHAQIVNGGFETPAPPPHGFTNFLSGSTLINGWSVVGPEVSIVSNTYTSFGIDFPAQSGSAWLDLTGDLSNRAEGVQQTFTTVPGTTYNVTFWVGNVVNPGGPYGTTSTVNMTVNGSPAFSATNSGGAGTSTQFWQQFTTSFTASGTSTTLAFLNGDPASDNTNGLDNVVVTAGGNGTPSTVPEPSTLAMLATGLIGLVPLVRRRVR